jgi:ElaB/YqjD/DUF883 family membrane-anchored ribosome-binding protein
MENTTTESDKTTNFKFPDLGAKLAEGKMLCEDFTENGKQKAKRLIRKGREAADDCLDETTYYVKHNPWQSLGIAAGVGVLAGWFCGWTCARVCK